jgi:hypothetical protein
MIRVILKGKVEMMSKDRRYKKEKLIEELKMKEN